LLEKTASIAAASRVDLVSIWLATRLPRSWRSYLVEDDRELEARRLDVQEQLSDATALDALLDVLHLDEGQSIQPVHMLDRSALVLFQQLRVRDRGTTRK